MNHAPSFVPRQFRLRPAIAVVSLALLPLLASAAGPTADKAMQEQLKKVMERMGQLEQRNQALEKRVQELSKNGVPAPATANTTDQAQWTSTRDAKLQAIELQQQSLQQEVQSLARPVEVAEESGGDKLKVEGGILAVYQGVNAAGADTATSENRINYRGDIALTLQGGSVGEAKATAFGQLRFGQGSGLALRPSYTSTPNTTAFEAGGITSAETYAIVAQAWYQLEWPLDGGRFNDSASSRVEMTVGKMDLFAFFDQNAVAGDEGKAFMNNAFVHNPMLDSGGDTGADAYGFAPGLRAAYFNEGENLGWGVSMGVFASGDKAAAFNGSPSQPLVIGQFEISPRQINGEARSTYRLYAWTNGNSADFNGLQERHSGFGLSADQRLGRDWNVFGRYGQRTSGVGTFNNALTAGFELGGRGWGRGGDAIGLAGGWLNTSSDWSDATADGSLVGYAATGAERVAEIYYRLKVNDKLSITPDLQLVQRAGGDAEAPSAWVVGVRANLGF